MSMFDKRLVGIMKKGMKANGTLKKGFRFKKGGAVVKAMRSRATKKR